MDCDGGAKDVGVIGDGKHTGDSGRDEGKCGAGGADNGRGNDEVTTKSMLLAVGCTVGAGHL